MSAILYPVAANGDAALSAPLGRAAREREAGKLAGQAVIFTTEPVGPAFATREAALDAYRGRLEDDRSQGSLPPEDRYCRLAEAVAAGQPPSRLGPVKPSFRDGRRWPAPAGAPQTVWRLQISYWRIAAAGEAAPTPQARRARRQGAAADLPAETLRAMARQPLRPIEPQRPLDIGLFETRLPEAPHIIVPDE